VQEVMKQWGELAVEGHFTGPTQWLSYHRLVSAQLARVVGALPSEVVAMNTLSVNLHLMMVSFYRPTAQRPVILMEAGAFPTDRHAVEAQIRFHGFDPAECLVEVQPDEANGTISLTRSSAPSPNTARAWRWCCGPACSTAPARPSTSMRSPALPACRAHASASTWRTRSATCRCACMTSHPISPCGATTNTSTAARARWPARSCTSAITATPPAALCRLVGP
jgi:hypothetical protein